jgi:hypothetical protein
VEEPSMPVMGLCDVGTAIGVCSICEC